ncbi:MAG: AGE family epimerase/isomerase [Bacteroidales bacterium]
MNMNHRPRSEGENGSLIRLRSELEEELRNNILPFWMEHLPDREKGGFHGHITHLNEVVVGASRGAIQNARILWTFSAAFRRYPEKAYLETALRAFDYILLHFLDRDFGGIFWELDAYGRVKGSRKQIYANAFVLYAMAEYYRATGSREALETAIALFEEVERHALDRERNGYIEALGRRWEEIGDMRLSAKDDNERKTMNTHLHILEAYTNLLRVWKDPGLEAALRNLIHLFLDHFIDPDTKHLRLFFDDDWNAKSDLVSFGHDIECSWLLHESAMVLGDSVLEQRTGEQGVEMARVNLQGLDGDGGLFYEYFPAENRYDTDKHWWPQAEAMVGYFNAWQRSGEPLFLEQTLASWQFIREKMVDRKYGEWYWSVNREGVPQLEKEKAGFWKCPYHNGRACLEITDRIDALLGRATH